MTTDLLAADALPPFPTLARGREGLSVETMLDWLLSLDDDPRERFLRLHEDPGADDKVSHPLRGDFADYLDTLRAAAAASGPQRPHGTDVLRAGRQALARAHRPWAIVVERTCFRRPPLKETELGQELGITQQAVNGRKQQGVAWLYAWCRVALGERGSI